jgi:GYF domain 2
MRGEGLIIQLIIMVVFASIASAIASSKGRSTVGWFFGGFFLGIFGIIIVAVLPNLKEQRAKEEAIERENRRLREQLVQEQIKTEAFRRHASARLDVHDNHMGIDTRSLVSPLPAPNASLALPMSDDGNELKLASDNWDAGAGQPASAPLTQQPAGFQSPANLAQTIAANATPHQSPVEPKSNDQVAVTATRQWYFERQGTTQGPVSDQQLVDLAKQGKITSATLIWTEQLHDWKPAGTVKPLQPYLQS